MWVGDRCIEGGEEFAQHMLAGLAVVGAHRHGFGGVIRPIGVVIGVVPAIEQASSLGVLTDLWLNLVHQAKGAQPEDAGWVTRGRLRGMQSEPFEPVCRARGLPSKVYCNRRSRCECGQVVSRHAQILEQREECADVV